MLLRQLEALRGEGSEADDDARNEKSEKEHGTSAIEILESLLTIENKFSSRLYDPRTERISRFGKESVEKIDGNSSKRFRPSPFCTPNQLHWPPFDVCGAQLRKKVATAGTPKKSSSPDEYVVDVSSEESLKAEYSLQNAINSSDIDSLFAHWKKFPYHLPTGLQIYRTAAMINQEEASRQAVEMALYTCGIILAGFPETGNYFRHRRLNGQSSQGSAMVLKTIHLGLHLALKKGCGRTAFEMCKLLISMDCEDDVECGWSIIDYVAIRSSQFDWIRQLSGALHDLCLNNNSNSNRTTPSPASSYLYSSLMERYHVLPQLTYGSALAFCFQHDSDRNPDMCLYEAILPAVRRMPFVAAELAVAVGVPESVDSIAILLTEISSKQNDTQSRITRLYIKRNTELWRTKNLPGLLRRAIDEYVNNELLMSGSNVAESVTNFLTKRPVSIVQRHYALDETEEHIMGDKPQAMPNELLRGGQPQQQQGQQGFFGGFDDDDGGDDGPNDEHGAAIRGGGRGRGGRGGPVVAGGFQLQQRLILPPETPEHVRDQFTRFEALFGPIRPQDIVVAADNGNNNTNSITIQQLLDYYDQKLKDRVEKRKQREQEEQKMKSQDSNNNNNNNDDKKQEEQVQQQRTDSSASDGNLLTTAAASVYNLFRTFMPENAAALLSSFATRDTMLLEEMKASGVEDPVKKFDLEHPDDMMFEPSRRDDDDVE